MKVLCLVHLKIFCYFCFSRAIHYEKKTFTDEESEKADEFHVSQNYLGQSSSKNISKKILWVFYVFQI